MKEKSSDYYEHMFWFTIGIICGIICTFSFYIDD